MFKTSGGGHLVLISSVLANKGVPGVEAAYAASKAGVSSLGESLRAEYPKGPIKVTVIEPGYIESEMTAKSEIDDADGRQRDRHQGDGRRDRTRTGPGRRAGVAVGAAGAGAAAAAAATRRQFA